MLFSAEELFLYPQGPRPQNHRVNVKVLFLLSYSNNSYPNLIKLGDSTCGWNISSLYSYLKEYDQNDRANVLTETILTQMSSNLATVFSSVIFPKFSVYTLIQRSIWWKW